MWVSRSCWNAQPDPPLTAPLTLPLLCLCSNNTFVCLFHLVMTRHFPLSPRPLIGLNAINISRRPVTSVYCLLAHLCIYLSIYIPICLLVSARRSPLQPKPPPTTRHPPRTEPRPAGVTVSPWPSNSQQVRCKLIIITWPSILYTLSPVHYCSCSQVHQFPSHWNPLSLLPISLTLSFSQSIHPTIQRNLFVHPSRSQNAT